MSDSRRRPSDNEKDNLYSKSLSNNETPAESMNNKRPRPTSPNNCRWDDPIKQFSEVQKCTMMNMLKLYYFLFLAGKGKD